MSAKPICLDPPSPPLQKQVCLSLPFPVSVNEMYVNRKGNGRNRYPSAAFKAWTEETYWKLHPQVKNLWITDRVDIEIDLDDRRQGDCDSRTKCVVDMLVKIGVIADDRKKYVRSVKIGWAQTEGCLVRITPIGSVA